ncbi:MAG: CHAD domain-containing protein [Vicinamibacterales bacterium]|nr:CHAD domain-containing protein [Vicinamibacterales bacterium]
MNPHTSHDRLWRRRLNALAVVWPDFLAGETKALHEARVASRRLREALPVVAASAPASKSKKLKRRLQALTQSLGPIRELDVELGMLDKEAESDAVPRVALTMVRREVAARRRKLRHSLDEDPPADIKKLIKKLGKIGKREEGRGESKWRSVLGARLLRRAKDVRAALDAAGPLYTPERIHGVRISTKKLRYAVEIAHEVGTPGAAQLVRALKKHQGRLGRLHDFQGLLKHVREAEASPVVGSRITDLTAYAEALERECRHLHADFLEHRDALVACLNEVKYELIPALTTPVRRQASVDKALRTAKGAHGKRAV